MKTRADEFLATFNRIEKWMQEQYKGKGTVGFTDLVRRLSKRPDLLVKKFQDDLIEIAQLRNAIVHDRISPNFIIAEPNEWIVKKIKTIESDLKRPERIVPRFKKKVIVFSKETSLTTILDRMAKDGFSQFPIYDKGEIVGLLTANGIGLWLAAHGKNNQIDVKGQTAASVLQSDRKKENYKLVSKDAFVFEGMELFLNDPTIEAILITDNGKTNGKLMGLIRPKEFFQAYYEEWRKR